MKQIKQLWKLFLIGVVLLITGIITINTLHHEMIGCLPVLIGFYCILGSIIVRIGLITPKLYKFVHLYKQADILNNMTSIEIMSKKDITWLRNSMREPDGTIPKLRNIFKYYPILENVRTHHKGDDGWHYVQIIGWVYASDKEEAKRTLHYHDFGEDIEEDTPAFFNVDSK